MLPNRHRGLIELHNTLVLAGVLAGFWIYAEIVRTWFSETIRLTREARLLPYVFCLGLGLLLSGRLTLRLKKSIVALSGGEALGLAAQQVAVVALVMFSLMFATQDTSISRLFLGTSLVLMVAGIALLHANLPRWLAVRVFGESTPTIFVGPPQSGELLGDWLSRRKHLGIASAGFAEWAEVAQTGERTTRLEGLLEETGARQVVLLELPPSAAVGRGIVELCQRLGCRLLVEQRAEKLLGHPLVLQEEAGQVFLTLHEEPLEEPLNRVLKRGLDLVLALPLVVTILPPLCLLVWLMQRWQAPGPLFHIRERTGSRGDAFAMVKFRTMRIPPTPTPSGAEKQATSEDGRVFPFGRFLRRHSLDEFPQFWHVLTGRMSAVGPRPVMPWLDEEFERRAKAYRTRQLIKPGITGLAQCEGLRGEILTPDLLETRIQRDLYYLAHWSLWLDLQILAKTAWQIFFPPKSAY